ncbi:MAG: NAD(P) transhydrogenase subunit alpha [Candidatus Omnitrophica bacterium]|nr:NAD(P) transhydrogenase subunit alpha [Candidatus Omnitrophota bacterium]
MIIGAITDNSDLERRIPLTPQAVSRLVKKGAAVMLEPGSGAGIHVADELFVRAGAKLVARGSILSQSDILLRVRKPAAEDIAIMKSGVIHLSFLDPFNEKDLISTLASRGVSAISLEMIPRTTIAQKMDALSSQANLSGYVAVVIAAERLSKILPMMTTPAGTISQARVFVIGVGVAGLQAIATAKRLGARVEAFDTRPVVKEQVQSLGAKFVEVDLGETGQTKDGYAKALTPEQLALQRDAMAKVCAQSDIVITTAQVFGRQAPIIVTRAMLSGMQPGSIVVDLAVETGGNVEGVELNREIDVNGVTLIGLGNLPGRVAVNASDMLAANFVNFIEHFWSKDKNAFALKLDDEIIKGCLVTHGGRIVNPKLLPQA